MTTEHTTKGLVLLGVLALVVAAVIGATALTASAQDNEVEFEGGIELSGNPSDGTTYTYTADDLEAVDDLSVELKGRVTSSNRTVSKQDLSNGDSLDLDVGGTTTADVDVEFTGKQQLASRTHSTGSSGGDVDVNRNGEYVVSDGSTIEVYDADGSLRWSDSGYSPNDVEITTDAVFVADGGLYRLNIDDGTQTASGGVGSGPGKIGASENSVLWNDGGTVDHYDDDLNSESSSLNPYDGGASVDGDGSYTITGMANEGNSCYDCVYVQNGPGNRLWKKSFSTTPDVAVHDTGNGALVFVHAEDTIFAYDEDGTELWTADAPDGATGIETDGETVQFIVGAQIVEHSTSDGSHVRTRDTAHSSDMVDIGAAASYHTVTYGGDALAESWRDADAGSPALSAGSTTWSHSGDLSTGETATATATIDPGSYSADLSAAGGAVDVDMTLKERTESVDPSVTVNGQTTTYDGTLAEGQTATLDADPSAIQSGENTVEISVSESVSGPAGAVGFNYSHDAQSAQSVDYSGEAWSERYNVTRTFAADQSGVDLSIPFESSRVVSIRDVQILSDGSWRPATESEYSLNGTTLSTDVGDVDAGERVGVRANGTKVDVQTGAIEVTDPTVEGDDLSSGIEVVDGSDGLEVEVGGTVSGDLLHYLGESSWNANERAVIDGESQLFRMPEAPTGGTATVATAPLDVDAEGDAVVLVGDASEPRFTLRPGESSDDTVSIRYMDAKSGETYDLLDAESEAVVDRNTASSPVLLETTDEERSYLISLYEGDTAGGGGGGGGGGSGALGPIPADQNPTPWSSLGIPMGILAIAVGVVLLFLARVRFGSSGGQADTSGPLEYVSSIAGRGGSWITGHPIVGAALLGLAFLGMLASGLINVPEGTVPALFTVGVPIGSYLVLQRTGRYDGMVWALTSVVAVIMGLVWMGVDLFGQLISSRVSLILAIGVLYLAYKALQAYRSPDETNEIVIGGNQGDNS